MLISLEFLGGPSPGHLRWDRTDQRDCSSAPPQAALSMCPCPCASIVSPFSPAQGVTGLFTVSLCISNPCLPSMLTKTCALARPGHSVHLPLLGESAAHATPTRSSLCSPLHPHLQLDHSDLRTLSQRNSEWFYCPGKKCGSWT